NSGGTNWFSFLEITIDVNNLAKGTHNYTIIFEDESGNQISSFVWVSVFDETNPIFLSTPGNQNIIIIEDTINNFVYWDASDLYPANYSILQDNVEVFESNWNNTSSISYDLDYLEYGFYNFTLLISDHSYNTINQTIWVDVLDTKVPEITDNPGDSITVVKGSSRTLSWIASEKHPKTYTIELDGGYFTSGLWKTNDKVTIGIPATFNPGFYNFTITFFDLSDNSVSHSIVVRIKLPGVIDTNRPEISLVTTVFEGDFETISGNWTTVNDTIIEHGWVFIEFYDKGNDKVFSQEFLVSNSSYSLKFNYSGYEPEEYYWEIRFESVGYQNWTNYRFDIDIQRHTYRLDLQLNEELIPGEKYYMTTIVYYNNTINQTTSILSLNEINAISGPVEGISVLFSLRLRYGDDTVIKITKSAISDENGVALAWLNPSETSNLVEIMEIRSIVEETKFNNVSTKSPPSGTYPEITGTDSGLLPFIEGLINEYLYYIFAGFATIFGLVILSLAFRRRAKESMLQLNTTIRVAEEELSGLLSLQAIILQTSTKLTIYEEEFKGTSVQSSLIGGMVTAFSSFLDEIGKRELFGFEMMEREGVSITSHYGKLSNFIVISKEKLPLVILDQVVRAQNVVEKEFKSNFTKTSRGVKRLKKDEVTGAFEKAGLKTSLIGDYELHERNIKKLLKERSISTNIKTNVNSLIEFNQSLAGTDIKLSYSTVYDYFRSREMSVKMSARAIILAYQYRILIPIGSEIEEN
ncbi:MAG: hypothetical protein ACXAD7_01390, partial [Candidatus Kariarchaeaceae archaeon]